MNTTISLKGRALRLLATREHSRLELQRKLAPHAIDADEVTALLDDLEQRGWLSTERLVASVVHRRAERFGTARIRQELIGKGLEMSQISDTLSQLRDTELERARAVWQHRFSQPPNDSKEHARQTRFLLGRGFSADIIRRVLHESGATGQDIDAL